MFRRDVALRRAREEEEKAREKVEKPTKERRERIMRSIYGRGVTQMAEDNKARRQRWIEEEERDPQSWTLRQPDKSVLDHTFRDRQPSMEVGREDGTVSAQRYVPRAAYRGGGQLDEDKTAKLQAEKDRQSVLRGNDDCALYNPGRGSSMVLDTAGIRGRIEHPQYCPAQLLLRERNQALELGHDMTFQTKNDMERLWETVQRRDVLDSGEYMGDSDPQGQPQWRDNDPSKWRGVTDMRVGTRANDNKTRTVAGYKFPASIFHNRKYSPPEGLERTRHPDKELSMHSRFLPRAPLGRYIPAPESSYRSKFNWKEEDADPTRYPPDKTYFISWKGRRSS